MTSKPLKPQAKVFCQDEVRALIPWLMEISADAEKEIIAIQQQETDRDQAQKRVQAIIHYWLETVIKLGAIPKQPFTVDFDSGSDYFCWEYPEEDIYYRHEYHLGYAGRHRIEESS
ncbi:DUF2203 family protein [Acanthopleuribacter pedis]|uniref:DUF2203 family protein n=1 Tax=Acanthopleuribacter pedis TaxID=442870 RepID=A0A8J7U2D2_9BACT|nr:DUF2203 family protein [Acanthopleuribacter pedis]MBO1319188.1 DUF2203 family protein [Acanthopleuribacter pedis]